MRITLTAFFIVMIVCMMYPQAGSSWQLQVFAGENVSHKSKRIAPETTHYGFAIDYSRKTTGRYYWQYAHNYPQTGLQLSFKNLGNDSVYGYAVSALPYLEFNVWESRFGIFQIKHGTGLAYVSKTYSALDNPNDLLISTHLNATSILDFGYRIFLSSKCDIKAGIVLHHISNGGFQLPNHGINTAFAYLGFSYYPFGNTVEKKAYAPQRDFRRIKGRLGASFGFYNHREGKLDINPQVSAMAFYQHNTRFRTGIGLEAGRPANYPVQLAVYAEEEVQFAHMVTRYGFGAYILNKRLSGEDFYSKIGIGYYPKLKNDIPVGFYIGALLKAHQFTAAHIELTTGYTF